IFDFMNRVDPKCVNKRALEGLARAGAFDRIHPNRRQIVEQADVLMAYAQASAEQRGSNQLMMFGGGEDLPPPRLARAEPWIGPERLDEELSAVGFYLSGHPLEDMIDVLKRRRVSLMVEATTLAEAAGDTAFRMAGVVRRRQERASARTGEKFAFVTFSDPTGEFEVLFPPEQLRKCREVLEPGASVLLKIRAKCADGEVRFFGDDAEPIDAAVSQASNGLRVLVSPRTAEVEALKSRLLRAAADRGGGEVALIAMLDGGREVEVRLPGRYKLDASLRGALKAAPGVLMLEDA
ncbi:MAG TPA: OB-fold nucleic acid binding domain-containing protein, partial [Caulobacteraceae bacterium]